MVKFAHSLSVVDLLTYQMFCKMWNGVQPRMRGGAEWSVFESRCDRRLRWFLTAIIVGYDKTTPSRTIQTALQYRHPRFPVALPTRQKQA